MSTPLLQVRDLKKYFPVSGSLFGTKDQVHAVDGVSFHIDRGETLSLVGESGCGKSTIGRAVLRLFDVTAGEVLLEGRRIDNLPNNALHHVRRRVQVVFQDPFASLNPRMKVGALLAEPMRNFGLVPAPGDLTARVSRLIDIVRLPRDTIGRYPHEFSGGQRQRIAIARALSAEPDLIVCDEAVSALDVAVMYLGQIVEIGPKARIFGVPAHPYTRALLSAVPLMQPGLERNRIILKGDVPSPIAPPRGCRFHTRCPVAFDRCMVEAPQLRQRDPGHWAACHLDHAPGRDSD